MSPPTTTSKNKPPATKSSTEKLIGSVLLLHHYSKPHTPRIPLRRPRAAPRFRYLPPRTRHSVVVRNLDIAKARRRRREGFYCRLEVVLLFDRAGRPAMESLRNRNSL